MTKTKIYKFGDMTFKPYFKPVGSGYEVGVLWSGKTVFVGNFIHEIEAKQWWNKMCFQIKYFINNHDFMPTASNTWYCKYMGNFLYKSYYNWLDKAFTKHTRTYNKATTQGFKQYKNYEKFHIRKFA